MLHDVLISMHAEQGVDTETPNALDFTTDGYYTFDDNVGCITYEESEVTGLEGTRTSVLVMPNQIIVDRDGTITSRMIFQEGGKTDFLYDTPFGNAVLGIKTRKISQNFDDKGGKLEIDYDINMEHTVFSRNRFKINVEKIGDRPNA